MGALRVVMVHPLIQIRLQLLNGFIEVLSKCHLIKFLQNGLVEPFADAIGLWMFDLGFGVVNVVDGKEELVVMLVRSATELGSPIRHDT